MTAPATERPKTVSPVRSSPSCPFGLSSVVMRPRQACQNLKVYLSLACRVHDITDQHVFSYVYT
jgi:hypothetical protein